MRTLPFADYGAVAPHTSDIYAEYNAPCIQRFIARLHEHRLEEMLTLPVHLDEVSGQAFSPGIGSPDRGLVWTMANIISNPQPPCPKDELVAAIPGIAQRLREHLGDFLFVPFSFSTPLDGIDDPHFYWLESEVLMLSPEWRSTLKKGRRDNLKLATRYVHAACDGPPRVEHSWTLKPEWAEWLRHQFQVRWGHEPNMPERSWITVQWLLVCEPLRRNFWTALYHGNRIISLLCHTVKEDRFTLQTFNKDEEQHLNSIGQYSLGVFLDYTQSTDPQVQGWPKLYDPGCKQEPGEHSFEVYKKTICNTMAYAPQLAVIGNGSDSFFPPFYDHQRGWVLADPAAA